MKTPTVVSRGLFLRPLKFKGAFAIQTSFIDELNGSNGFV